MFKNMSLSAKMALGFGVLIVIAGALGVVTWRGLASVSGMAALDRSGSECLAALNSCAALRRDFALQGFTKADGESKNAAEKWKDAHSDLTAQLGTLQNEPGLQADEQALVRTAQGQAEVYRTAFDKQVAARTARDDAFDAWREIGMRVTQDVRNVLDTVINPALRAAQDTNDLAELTRWSNINDRLDKEVVQPFLLLRVCAVYYMATNKDEQWVAYQEQMQNVMNGLKGWQEVIQGETQLETVAANFQGYFQRYETAGEQYHGGVVSERAAETEMVTAAAGVVDTMNQLKTRLADNSAAITDRTNRLNIGMALAAIAIGVTLAVLITRSIVRPINRIIAGLNEGSEQVNDAAGQVASASQQLAAGASEQASSLEETSSALEQMAAMTRTNAENAKQARDLSELTKNAAQEGDRTMGQLNNAMSGINESSGQISKIIKVIEEIAFQTNLLALNAAVEAARAGEHGKGFAVVADEVRNLAQRAAQASREVTGLIEDSVSKARDGTTVAAEVGKSLGAIVSNVSKVADLVNGITRASEEQAQGVEQVNVAVSQMDKVTQQNAAGAEESASAAEELAAQATTVKSVVEELATVIRGAHGSQSGATAAYRPASHSPSRPRAMNLSRTANKQGPPAGHSSTKEPAAQAAAPNKPSEAPAATWSPDKNDLNEF